MELLQLRYFYETAKNGSIAQTAADHWVPASSVSASIKRLEQELGCQLFDRQSNRITLNKSGKKLQNSLRVIFDELDETVAYLKRPAKQVSEIRILVLTMRERIVNTLVEYQKNHPDVHIHAMFNANNDVPSQYDVIVDQECDAYPEYNQRELCSFQLCFKAPANSPLVGKMLTMKDLRNQSFITMDTNTELNSALLEGCKNADFYPNIVIRTNDPSYYTRCVQNKLGIGLWRKYNDPKNDGLEYLTVTDFHARQTMYLYFKRNTGNEALNSFVDFLTAREF